MSKFEAAFKALPAAMTEPWDEYLKRCEDKPRDAGRTDWEFKSDDHDHNPRWVAVYVVTGGSEGYYLHIDRVDNRGNRVMWALGKSLGASWEACWLSAGKIAKVLEEAMWG